MSWCTSAAQCSAATQITELNYTVIPKKITNYLWVVYRLLNTLITRRLIISFEIDYWHSCPINHTDVRRIVLTDHRSDASKRRPQTTITHTECNKV